MNLKVNENEKVVIIFGDKLDKSFNEMINENEIDEKQNIYRTLGRILYKEYILNQMSHKYI